MKLSIRSFLVATCLLLAHQAVESSETSSLHQITTDAIANVLAASGPVSHRSLEDMDNFESMIDDPDVLTCLSETQELFEDYQLRKGVDFTSEAADMLADSLEMTIGKDSSTMKTTYTAEVQNFIRNVCSDVGGKYDAIGDFVCEFEDGASGIEFTAEYSGMAYCWADIPQCKAGNTFLFYAAAVIAAGGTCTEPSGGSSISVPGGQAMTEQTDPDGTSPCDSS